MSQAENQVISLKSFSQLYKEKMSEITYLAVLSTINHLSPYNIFGSITNYKKAHVIKLIWSSQCLRISGYLMPVLSVPTLLT